MSKVALMIAPGCEEIEALTVTDILRRANITLDMISITDEPKATGSHGITFETDAVIADADFAGYDAIVLPGGMPGTTNLGANATVVAQIKEFAANGKTVAAICAAPTVLGANGLLEGKKATCYPGLEDKLTGAEKLTDEVVIDGNIITSRGMGTAIPFALALVARFTDEAAAKKLGEGIVYMR